MNRGLGDPFDYDIEAPLGVELLERGRTPEEIAEAFRSHALDPEVWAPVRSTRTVYEKVTAEQLLAMAWETFRGIEATVFKRVQAPPILKVSKKAFGFDLRESVFARLRYE